MKRAKTIPLKTCRTIRNDHPTITMTAWVQSPPFAVNPRGILVHRVRHVTMICWADTGYRGKSTHHHATYLCGNGTNFNGSQIDDILVSDPPDERLLCTFCEARAKQMKLPTGDTLAGRHVHRGRLIPEQTCCQE